MAIGGGGNGYGDVGNNQNYKSDTVAIIVGSGNNKDNNDDWRGGSWARGGTMTAISGSQVAVIGGRIVMVGVMTLCVVAGATKTERTTK